MACNMTAALFVLLIVSVLFVAGAQADTSEFLPPVARRAGPLLPPPPATSSEKDNCQMIQEPSLVDACRRRPNGVANCAAQCVLYKNIYHGGHCDVLPNGLIGDCTCITCFSSQE